MRLRYTLIYTLGLCMHVCAYMCVRFLQKRMYQRREGSSLENSALESVKLQRLLALQIWQFLTSQKWHCNLLFCHPYPLPGYTYCQHQYKRNLVPWQSLSDFSCKVTWWQIPCDSPCAVAYFTSKWIWLKTTDDLGKNA